MSDRSRWNRPRNLALAVLALLVGAGGVVWSSEDAGRAVRLRAAEAAGEAVTRIAQRAQVQERAADFIATPVEVRKIGGFDFLYQATGVGNTHLIATSEGHVVFDTGLSIQAAKQRRLLEEAAPEAPVTHVILSHSHQDHAGGAPFWSDEGTEIVAHREYPEEQRYLKELEDYLHFRNRTLFPWMPEEPSRNGLLEFGNVVPTRLVPNHEPYRFEQGGIRFEVLPTPGAEGADNLCLWLPDQKVLFSGDTFGPIFPQFPNVFTMRGEKVRKPVEYIATLERLIALEPELVVPSHQEPIGGKQEIRAALVKMRDAVRHVHDATVAGMNAGKSVHELMAEIVLPPELALSQAHGRVSWAVKSIWEYYATWFHFDTTTELYPVPAAEVYPELTELAGADALAERARAHVEAGRPVHALHLLDIALGGEPLHRPALEARREALQRLHDEAETGLGNSYEMDWLLYRLRLTQEALDATEG